VRSGVPRKAPQIQRMRVLCMSAPVLLADTRTGERLHASARARKDTWPPVELPAVPCPPRSPVGRRVGVDPATASRFLGS